MDLPAENGAAAKGENDVENGANEGADGHPNDKETMRKYVVKVLLTLLWGSFTAYGYLFFAFFGQALFSGIAWMAGSESWIAGTIPAFLFLLNLLYVKYRDLVDKEHLLNLVASAVIASASSVGICLSFAKILGLTLATQTPMGWLAAVLVFAGLDTATLYLITKRFSAHPSLKSPRALRFYAMVSALVMAMVQALLQAVLQHRFLPYPMQGADKYYGFNMGLQHSFYNTPLLLLIGWLIGTALMYERQKAAQGIKSNSAKIAVAVSFALRAVCGLLAVAAFEGARMYIDIMAESI